MILERPFDFEQCSKGIPLVALTATPGNSPYERQAYDRLQFTETLLPPLALQKEFLTATPTSIEEIQKLIYDSQDPLLIYCSNEQYNQLRIEDQENYKNGQITGIDLSTGEEIDGRHPDLKRLERPQIRLWATDEQYLRAIDYRSPRKLYLIVLQGFSTMRASQQGLGRVGRQEDDCSRLILDTARIVDDAQENAIIRRMNEELLRVEEQRRNESLQNQKLKMERGRNYTNQASNGSILNKRQFNLLQGNQMPRKVQKRFNVDGQ